MNGIEPMVRHMILCDNVRRNPNNPNKIDILGLISTVRPAAGSTYPLPLSNLCVYLNLTGGRGTGAGQINVRHADSDIILLSSAPLTLIFPADPLALAGLIFRVRNCVLPQAGLYWIEFCYNQKVLAQQPILAK
jgi:hypothetical protein